RLLVRMPARQDIFSSNAPSNFATNYPFCTAALLERNHPNSQKILKGNRPFVQLFDARRTSRHPLRWICVSQRR
ncbi:MAG TPA: hypothetical protein PK586_15900, partial [Casimicrobium sp.]|nr:hypothetical protein [Casimicrobium sp.]